MERVFHITLSQVLAKQLPKKDLFTKCDSYIVFKWADLPPLRTPTIQKDYDPQWRGWKNKFDYTVLAKQNSIDSILREKLLVVECYAEHSFREDSLIGRVTLDLLSVLAGPSLHIHDLVSLRGQTCGLIEFSIIAECVGEITVEMGRIMMHSIPQTERHLFLRASLFGSICSTQSHIVFKSKEPYWNAIPFMCCSSSVQGLLESQMTIEAFLVEGSVSNTLATFQIPLQKYVTSRESEWSFFREFQYLEEDEKQESPYAMIEGQIRISNLPLPCQMKFGCNQNHNILDSAILLSGFYSYEDDCSSHLVRLQDPVYQGYDISKIPSSPFEIPCSSIHEIEIRQHIEQLQQPMGTWEKSLAFLSTDLKDDPMAKQTFLQSSGIHEIVQFLDKNCIHTENIVGDQNISICVWECMNVFINAIENFPANVAVATNKKTVSVLTSLFVVSSTEKQVRIALIEILTHIAERSSKGRNKLLKANWISLSKENLADYPAQILCLLRALTFVLPFEDQTIQLNISNRLISESCEDLISNLMDYLDNVELLVRKNTLLVIQQIASISDSFLDIVMHYILPVLSKASEDMFPLLLDILAESITVHVKGSINPLADDVLSLVNLLHDERGIHCRDKMIKILQFLLYQQSTQNEALRSAVFQTIQLQNQKDFKEIIFSLEVLQWLGTSSNNQSGSLLLLQQNFTQLLHLLDHNDSFIHSQSKSTLSILCHENFTAKEFDTVLVELLKFSQRDDISVRSLLSVLTLWETLVAQCNDKVLPHAPVWDLITKALLSFIDESSNTRTLTQVNQINILSWECLDQILRFPDCMQKLLSSLSATFTTEPNQRNLQVFLVILRLHSTDEEVLHVLWDILQNKIIIYSTLPSWKQYVHRFALQFIDIIPQTRYNFSHLIKCLPILLADDISEEINHFGVEVLQRITFTWSIDHKELTVSPKVIDCILSYLLAHIHEKEPTANGCHDLFLALMRNFLDVKEHGIIFLSNWITSDFKGMEERKQVLDMILEMPILHTNVFFSFLKCLLLWYCDNISPELYDRVIQLVNHFLQNGEMWEDILLISCEVFEKLRTDNAQFIVDLLEHIAKAIPAISISLEDEISLRKKFIEEIGFTKLVKQLCDPILLPYFDRLQFMLSILLGSQDNTCTRVIIENNFSTEESLLNMIEILGNIQNRIVENNSSEEQLRTYQIFLTGLSCLDKGKSALFISKTSAPKLIDILYMVTQVLLKKDNVGTLRLLGDSLQGLSQILRISQEYVTYVSENPELGDLLSKLTTLIGESEDNLLFMQFCKFLRVVFFDKAIQSLFSIYHGYNSLARAIYRAMGYLRSSVYAKQAILEAVNFLCGAGQVKQLQKDIVRQAILPVIIQLLQSEADDSILVPSLGFIYFMSYDHDARVELIDAPEIDFLSRLIVRGKNSQVGVAARECFSSLGGVNVLCTITETGLQQYQEHFSCKTCGLSSVCKPCTLICHYNHILSPPVISQVVCRCGTSDYCLIKKIPSLRLQYPLRLCSLVFTGRNHEFQSWYFCRTCFRDLGKGICVTCSQICHQGHDVRFGNDSRFYCDCNERYGMTCMCLRSRPPVVPGKLPVKRIGGITDPLKETATIELVEQKSQQKVERRVNYSEDNTCTVCMDQMKEALFYPCGHIVACMECACMLKQRKDPCVICRETIEDVVRTYKV